ncbi:MAG: SDR family oxidoreductase [Myxococcota bacterium]|nr:SDR family oxidoreductase [Myxococcota bacterium]
MSPPVPSAVPGVLVVTGGSRGIGAATARLAAAAGWAVAVNYRQDRDAAEAVVRELAAAGARGLAVQADVSREPDVERLFRESESELGEITGLVNSAGINGNQSTVADFHADVLERLLAVNVLGTQLCCREAVRRMSTRLGGRGGAIVNVSSMAATIGGRAGASDYAASKAAVDVFTVGLAKEVSGEGVRVNCLRPGMTMTDMTDALRRDEELRARIEASIPMQRIAEADEIAKPIVWLLSEAASFISGACMDASGGGFLVR